MMDDSVYHPTNRGGDGNDPSRDVLAAGIPASADGRAGDQADGRAGDRTADRVPDSSSGLDDEEPPASSRGRFFAVHRRIWTAVCSLGMNPAVAYLVIACGTARDMVRSTWSVHAVEKYTSISRLRARDAIQTLVSSRVLTVSKANTRPIYRLSSARECLRSPRLQPPPSGDDWIWLPNTLVTGAADEIRRSSASGKRRT